VRKVQEARRVERRVGSVGWEGEREAARYEAVEGCVEAPIRDQYARGFFCVT
jgi:hypothetical protein